MIESIHVLNDGINILNIIRIESIDIDFAVDFKILSYFRIVVEIPIAHGGGLEHAIAQINLYVEWGLDSDNMILYLIKQIGGIVIGVKGGSDALGQIVALSSNA